MRIGTRLEFQIGERGGGRAWLGVNFILMERGTWDKLADTISWITPGRILMNSVNLLTRTDSITTGECRSKVQGNESSRTAR